MKPWIAPLLVVCVLSTVACSDQGSSPRALVVPRASGFPSVAEHAGIQRAATELAAERSAKPCSSVTDCGRATVLVDGKPVGDGFLTQVAQGLFLHDFGGTATAARFTSLMRDERSAFLRRALTATAYNGLLQLDASSVLTDEQRRDVEERLRGVLQSYADGSTTVSRQGSPGPLTAVEMKAHEATLRSSFSAQAVTEAIAKRPDPDRELRELIERALGRHRVEFTPGTELQESDVLAYAASAV